MIATHDGRVSAIGRAVMWFVMLAVLLAPFFAHGCHGDDLDHEPLVIPFKSYTDED